MLLCLRSPQDLTDVNVWLLLFNPDMHVQRLPGPSGLHGIVHPKCLCGLFGNSYTSQTACLLLILYLLPTKQFVLAVKQGFILCPAFIHHSADLTFVYLLHMHSKRWWWFMRLCWIGKASCSVVIHEPSCATRKNRSLPVVFIFEKKIFLCCFFFLHYCCGFIFSLLLPSSSHFIFIVICTVLDVSFCSGWIKLGCYLIPSGSFKLSMYETSTLSCWW